jgi:CxxC motif-containing protein
VSAQAEKQESREPIREMICISCPIGCHLELYLDDDENLRVEGNRCPRGEEYAREEYFAPKRVVTATARTESEQYPRVPVRTDKPLPAELMDALLEEVYRMRVPVPVQRGDVLIEDYQGTGVNLTASLTIEG